MKFISPVTLGTRFCHFLICYVLAFYSANISFCYQLHSEEHFLVLSLASHIGVSDKTQYWHSMGPPLHRDTTVFGDPGLWWGLVQAAQNIFSEICGSDFSERWMSPPDLLHTSSGRWYLGGRNPFWNKLYIRNTTLPIIFLKTLILVSWYVPMLQ